MKNRLVALSLGALIVVPALPAPALAQYDNYHDHHYYGRGDDYRYHCKRSSGTTGAIAGGVGGAVAGNALGGGALGTIAGGVGGALLGQHLDKKHDAAQNRRNGC
ncbi:MAG: hypothetical protein JOY99_09525 [Sphingomonadaceae bacterium]|nr:hypothetical protein [Sphingomonadaceae bacterium]